MEVPAWVVLVFVAVLLLGLLVAVAGVVAYCLNQRALVADSLRQTNRLRRHYSFAERHFWRRSYRAADLRMVPVDFNQPPPALASFVPVSSVPVVVTTAVATVSPTSSVDVYSVPPTRCCYDVPRPAIPSKERRRRPKVVVVGSGTRPIMSTHEQTGNFKNFSVSLVRVCMVTLSICSMPVCFTLLRWWFSNSYSSGVWVIWVISTSLCGG
jgi:hypothetical protein